MTSDGVERLMVSTADGRQLEVLLSGPKGAPVVVVHMGTPSGLVTLPSFIDPARRGLRTLLYARPGYAASTPQPGRLVADAAGDTARILDELRIDTCVSIGWSGGGPHVLACAALLSERCLAVAVVAGHSPYPSEAWSEIPFAHLSGDGDELVARLETVRTESLAVEAGDIAAMFSCEADRSCLTEEYAQWLALYIRSAYAVSAAGYRDDGRALQRAWGFDLADAKRVAVWHGSVDATVEPAHGSWLAGHIPNAEMHLLPNEGHISIGYRFPEIVGDLVERVRS